MTGIGRSSDGLDQRRKRLLYRAWHRGTREMDLLLGPFADARIADLSLPELDMLDELMSVPDPELYGWLTGAVPVPPRYDRSLFRQLATFHRRSGARHSS